jgi:hypothetical protein
VNAALPRPHTLARLQLWELVARDFTAADLHDPILCGALATVFRGEEPSADQLAAVRRAREGTHVWILETLGRTNATHVCSRCLLRQDTGPLGVTYRRPRIQGGTQIEADPGCFVRRVRGVEIEVVAHG